MSAVLIDGPDWRESVFGQIADELASQSFSVVPNALPTALAEALFLQVQAMPQQAFSAAGVGRSQQHTLNHFVRRDQVRWIEGQTPAEQDWLAWAAELQRYLNRHLYLGLFSFESHFAHYGPGDFYRKHLDAFKPSGLERGAQRILSLVTYLNPGWQLADGGELVIYGADGQLELLKVTPAYATVVAFLSTEVPHEVLPAVRDRYSIAGWFRRNGSLAERPDPPR